MSACQCYLIVNLLFSGKKDGPNCICVVQYTGDCLLSLKPTAEKDSAEKDSAQQEPAIVWKEFLLEGPVISCSSFENTIITTDGNWVRICELNSIENKSTCENLNCSCGLTVDVSTKSFVLKGIYKVSSDEDSVVLLTVDGRTYEYSWNSFLALFDKCDEGNAHEARFSGTSLDNILKEMERLSTVSNDLATEKDELRSYIQQLNLAQSLALNENKMVSKSYRETLKKSFELLYEITPSASDKFAFAIKISLKNTIRDVKFNHKWWHCKVSLNLPPKSEHVTFQLKAESSDHQILMSVTVEDLKNSLLNSLETSDSVNFLSCSLILKNYINKHAVCAIDVTKVNILLSDFLHESKLIKSSNPSTFADFISKSFPSSNLSQISCPKNQDIVLVYPATKNLLEKLHKISQNNYSQQPTEIEKHFPIKKDLYWCEHLVQFQASILSDKVCINLNSSCIPLIILLRREIEDLARKDSQKSKVRLSRTVVNEISNLSQILDLSLDYPDDSVPVSDLYCQISKIASQLP